MRWFAEKRDAGVGGVGASDFCELLRAIEVAVVDSDFCELLRTIDAGSVGERGADPGRREMRGLEVDRGDSEMDMLRLEETRGEMMRGEVVLGEMLLRVKPVRGERMRPEDVEGEALASAATSLAPIMTVSRSSCSSRSLRSSSSCRSAAASSRTRSSSSAASRARISHVCRLRAISSNLYVSGPSSCKE